MKYFILLAYLNLLDGAITFVGLRNEYIKEANPLMDWLWNLGPAIFLSSKIMLSILALILGVYFSPKHYIKQWNYTLFAVCSIYCSVIFLHLFWIILVVFQYRIIS